MLSHMQSATIVRERGFVAKTSHPSLEPLSLQFAIYMRNAPGYGVDVGCEDGIAAAAALARGGRVIVVDPDPKALYRTFARVPAEQHMRLRARIGALPTIDFKQTGFSAVHVARVLHLLDGSQIRSSLRKFFRWLYPSGKLFLSTYAPAGSRWGFFWHEYEKRMERGMQWPGYLPNVSRLWNRGLQETVHLLDERVLRRELESAGFVIDEMVRYPLPWDETRVCCAVIAHCETATP